MPVANDIDGSAKVLGKGLLEANSFEQVGLHFDNNINVAGGFSLVAGKGAKNADRPNPVLWRSDIYLLVGRFKVKT